MPTDHHHPIRSLARRKQRCRIALMTLLLFGIGAGALNDIARADIFLSTGPDGEERFSDRPPHSGPAVLVAPYEAKPSGNASASPITTPEVAAAVGSALVDASAGGEDHQPPAQAEPFKTDGPIAPGKAFTAGH